MLVAQYTRNGQVFALTAAADAALAGETATQTLTRVAGLIPGATNITVVDSAAILPTAAQLVAYAQAKQNAIATGSIKVNIGTSGAPVYVEAAMDALSLAWLTGAASIAGGNSSATLTWAQSTGPVTLTAAQTLTIYAAVQTFVQSTFAALGAVIAAINAGTITTTAQIDTPPAPLPAWPVNS
jgi:hypothetical protein